MTDETRESTDAAGPRALRPDVQALRGFAVLTVLFYHAKFSAFSSGFLGVDVFFVISGFLITRLIKDALDAGRFSLRGFYYRRAKRLLPAAYVTFLVTGVIAPGLLTSTELHDFRNQMIGAVTFSANLVLWKQSGYFQGLAELKPLLHVWSLSLEEQYYFFLPVAMLATPRRYWRRGLVLGLVSSIALCFVRGGMLSTFYVLPTRAWELGLGSLGALLTQRERDSELVRAATWPAIAALLALPVVTPFGDHPGAAALVVCLATLVLILREHPALVSAAATRALAWVGDRSYSLYLVHWPLFAFFNNVWIGNATGALPTMLRGSLAALSFALAYALHRWVEEPVRRADIQPSRRVVTLTLATSTCLVLLGAGSSALRPTARDYAVIRRANHGFGDACEFTEDFTPRADCRNSAAPEMLVWGDSYAMHLVPGILANVAGAPAVVQATRSYCGPLLGLSAVTRPSYDRAWAQACIRFNASVLAYLERTPSIRIVVLSSPFHQYVTDTDKLLSNAADPGDFRLVAAGEAEAVAGIRRTVRAVRALGRRVVFVAPPPSGAFDIGRCLERRERDLPRFGADSECRIDRTTYRAERRRILAVVAALPAGADVDVVGFDDYLCDAVTCKTHVDGTFLYRDSEHLSYDGSAVVANAVSLVSRITRTAR